MTFDDFVVGEEFYSGGGKWICISKDKSRKMDLPQDYVTKSRITAKKIKNHPRMLGVILSESVFEDYDFGGCSKTDRFGVDK